MLMCFKLLSANLEDADPAVYNILQKVGICNKQIPEKLPMLTKSRPIGETTAETFHQPHPL